MLVTTFLTVLAKADWAWVGGNQATNLLPSFGQLFVESPENSPGGVSDMAFATNGSFVYAFGGDRRTSSSNSLLRFNSRNQMWSALFSPSSSADFGDLGVFSARVVPIPKYSSAIFLDKVLNSVFIFGGYRALEEYDNSLFEFSFDFMLWRWIHGAKESNDHGNSGELEIESSSNTPASRDKVALFYDQTSRRAYIYGGRAAFDRAHADHWVYSVQNNTWTWIHGLQQTNSRGVYGDIGVGTLSTRPGARFGAAYAYDETRRKFYFYGGKGTSESSTFGYPTDLWQYEPDRNVWTFLRGSRDSEFRTNYGTKGVTQEGTFPRSRYDGPMVIDTVSQKAYIIGGTSEFQQQTSFLNDLWMLDLESLLWTWVTGSNTFNSLGRYGTKAIASPLNSPSSRSGCMVVFLKDSFQLLLYGGFRTGYHSDLWLYTVADSSEASTTSRLTTIVSTSGTLRERTASVIIPTSTSAEIVAVFITVPLLMVGIFAIVFACVWFRRLKTRDQKKPVLSSADSSGTNTVLNSRTSSANVTLYPTSLGVALPAHLEVKQLDFRTSELIASGGGGDVFYGDAIDSELSARCRYLVVKRPIIMNHLSLQLFEQEISVMYLLSKSRFVAKLVGFMIQSPALLMKRYVDGSLLSFAGKHFLNCKWKLRFSSDIARGLLDIHNALISHCDMKPQNVLVDRDPKGKPFCVITDFGIAQILSEQLLVVKYSQAVIVRGLSIHYAAPEVFQCFRNNFERNKHVIMAGDIFALAMTIYFMLCQNQAWD